ncbi:hypothetical protein RSAG8_11370, partial [Rhizoctonia solani AG-8 WAC10335]
MPTFAGYYVAPDDWVDWLRPRCPQYSLDPGMAEVLIQEAINEKKFGKYLAVIMVTSPESVPGRFKQGMMVYRVSSDKREYIHPRADSKIDLNGSRGLERLFGLKTSEWRSYWYNPNSLEMPYEAEFLEPTPLKANGNRSEPGRPGRARKRWTVTRMVELTLSSRMGRERGGY